MITTSIICPIVVNRVPIQIETLNSLDCTLP